MPEVELMVEKQIASWTQKQVYLMSGVCLFVGLAFGYLFRGSANDIPQSPAPAAVSSTSAASMPTQRGAQPQAQQQMPSLEDMKRMADKKAEPLLTQLKSDPKNVKLLIQIGNTYKSAHQFAEAANYFGQALALSPKDTALRDEVGAALYYAGDTDKAIATFEEGLKYNPGDASILFNLGVMKLQKKGDAKGAIESWERLLKSNPNLPRDKQEQIKKMIADARTDKGPAVN